MVAIDRRNYLTSDSLRPCRLVLGRSFMGKIDKLAHAAKVVALCLPPVVRSPIGLAALSRKKDGVAVVAGKKPAAKRNTLRRSGAMRAGDPPELLPPSAKRRPLLLKPRPRGTSPEFELLTGTVSHLPALMAIGECYLALPNPDANFVPDFQTSNFASRLFELYLLACFREQGLVVRQDHVSPDFWVEKDGAECWIEAVTANSDIPLAGGIGDWVHAPADRNERLTGAPAERFAKTLRGKLQRNYHELDHVKGRSFALAIADFHVSGSMVWSREALPTYLYGVRADVQREGQQRRAIGTSSAAPSGRTPSFHRSPMFAWSAPLTRRTTRPALASRHDQRSSHTSQHATKHGRDAGHDDRPLRPNHCPASSARGRTRARRRHQPPLERVRPCRGSRT
jgi:hypothetical protein